VFVIIQTEIQKIKKKIHKAKGEELEALRHKLRGAKLLIRHLREGL